MSRRSPDEPPPAGAADLPRRDGAGRDGAGRDGSGRDGVIRENVRRDSFRRENVGRENVGRENAGRDNPGARPRGADEPAWMWTDDDFAAAPDYSQDFEADLALGSPSRPALGAVIWRRAWLWGLTAVLGVMLGGAAFVVKPPPYKATTSVLLTQSPDQPPTDQILTEVALVQSRTVAQAAMRSLGLPLSVKAVEHFSANITATSVTDRVIQITVKGTSASAAVSAAKATAAAFLLIRNDELRSAERLTIASLTQQINRDKQRLQGLAAQIATFPAHGLTPAQQSKLAGLQAEQSQLKGTLTGLEQAATSFEATTAVTTASMVHGSQVLDPATPLPRSKLRYPALYFGGGLFGGLAVGLGLVVVQALVSRRLRRRDDVARVLGGPVLLSVGRVRAAGPLARSWTTASRRPAVRQIVAYLRRSLPAGPETATLAIVAVDDVSVPALALASLAASYARDGKRVLVADLTATMAVGNLLGVTEVGVKLTEADGQEVLVAIPEPGNGLPEGPVKRAARSAAPATGQPLDKAYLTADIMLTLTTLDPSVGADHLASWASDAVVMLTAGVSSVTKINAVGEMIRASGAALASAVLLGADRGDESLGFATSLADEVNLEPAAGHQRPAERLLGSGPSENAAGGRTPDSFSPIRGRDVNGGQNGGTGSGNASGAEVIGGEPSRAWRR